MNGWVKYASLALSAMLFINCNAAKHSRYNDSRIQRIDSLPATIILPEKEQNKAIYSTDSTSKLKVDHEAIHVRRVSINKLETDIINPKKVDFFEIKGLPYDEIQDLKIAVDDFGNINYLNPDF